MKLSFRFPATAASEATRARRRRSLLLMCIGIVVLPLAWSGPSCGQDFDFHLQSWLEVVRHWQQGVIYPHWAASLNYGAGEPRFVFYPPLCWVLGGLLGLILPWTWVPLAFTLVALLGLGFCFFAMAREWMPEDNAALAACFYVANPYVMFLIYERSALAELLGGLWIPLLVLFGLRQRRSLVPLALAVAALWLTNAPAAVMGCYSLLILAAAAAIQQRRWHLLLRCVGGSLLGIALAGFYILPAIHEQRWVEIARAIAPGMRIEDSFLFGQTGAAYHDQVLRMASWIAVALLAATAAAAFLARRNRRARMLWASLLLLAVIIAALQFPVSGLVWRHVPELAFLQFPWRWLLVLGLIFAVFVGLLLKAEAVTRKAIFVRAIAVLLLASGMTALAWSVFRQSCDEEDNVRAQIATFHHGGFEGTDEYTAQPADNGAIQQGLPLVRVLRWPDAESADSSRALNPDWQPDSSQEMEAKIQSSGWRGEKLAITVATPQPGFAVFRLMEYPAWAVWVNGVRVTRPPTRDDGLVVAPVEAGESRIDIHYSTTTDVWAGRAVSMAAVLVLLALWMGEKRRLNLRL